MRTISPPQCGQHNKTHLLAFWMHVLRLSARGVSSVTSVIYIDEQFQKRNEADIFPCRTVFLSTLTCYYINVKGYAGVWLKVGSHYERLYQRWPASEKSNKWAQTSAKLRMREGYCSFTLRTFYIRRNSTFTNVSKRLTAFDSVC